jgi:hypothetical protein
MARLNKVAKKKMAWEAGLANWSDKLGKGRATCGKCGLADHAGVAVCFGAGAV